MADDFQRLMAQLDYSLFIVTTACNGERSGCLVGFASQVSIHPPRFLVGLSVKNRTYRVANAGAEVLVVHFVPEQAEDLAELFGGETGDEVDKFERCRWRPGPAGVPVLDGVKGWVAGPVVGRFDVGDHVAFLVAVEAGADDDPAAETLGFQTAKQIEPGHPA